MVLTRGSGVLLSVIRDDKRRITYQELVQHAKAKGNAFHAPAPNHRSKPIKALVLDHNGSPLPLTAYGNSQQGIDTVHSMQEDGVSIPTSELPSTTEFTNESGQKNQVLYVGTARVQTLRPVLKRWFLDSAAWIAILPHCRSQRRYSE